MVKFSILGQLEVRCDERRVELCGHKQRAVLAALLIDYLWPQRPPARASATVQVFVSNLRRVLEPERPRGTPAAVLMTRAPGYLLKVEPDALDAQLFERLAGEGGTALAEGDPQRAVELLTEALGLWRGCVLADFPGEGFVGKDTTRRDACSSSTTAASTADCWWVRCRSSDMKCPLLRTAYGRWSCCAATGSTWCSWTYAATGNRQYRDYFDEILAIRNGTAARPDRYDHVYWDLVSDTGQRPTPFGPAVSFDELATRVGFTPAELDLLQRARPRSNALTRLERAAFAEVDKTAGPPEAADGSNRAAALLYGADYQRAKAEIMQPIGQVFELVDARTQQETAQTVGRASAYSVGAVGVALLMLGGIVVAAVVARRAIIRPVLALDRATERITAGDLEVRAPVGGVSEISSLATRFNGMTTARRQAEEGSSLFSVVTQREDMYAGLGLVRVGSWSLAAAR